MVARLSYKSKEGYGKQRLWGAVAWGGMSLLCGMMIDVGGLEMVFTYTWVHAPPLPAITRAITCDNVQCYAKS